MAVRWLPGSLRQLENTLEGSGATVQYPGRLGSLNAGCRLGTQV